MYAIAKKLKISYKGVPNCFKKRAQIVTKTENCSSCSTERHSAAKFGGKVKKKAETEK